MEQCKCSFLVLTLEAILMGSKYFGTMAGVRGFNDPNVQINPDGNPVWYQ